MRTLGVVSGPESADVPSGVVLQFNQSPGAALFQLALENAASDNLNGTVFEPDEVRILTQAFQEACAILDSGGTIGLARRTDIARSIISLARRGMRDPHRLALKAIVQAG
jgi:hypothetical protein